MPASTKQELSAADLTGSVLHAGECFSKIYLNIATAKASDPADLRRKIDAVTSIVKGLQQLTGLDAMAAQPILESINAQLGVLKAYPDILAQVESCLDKGLETEPAWREQLRKGTSQSH